MREELIRRANRDIVPLNDLATVEALWALLIDTPLVVQKYYWVRDREGGDVCVYGHEKFPGKVIEYVHGGQDDSITSLYAANSIFSPRKQLMDLRIELIREIKAATMTVDDSLTLFDGGRERHVKLKEMGTAQLIDTVVKIHRDTI